MTLPSQLDNKALHSIPFDSLPNPRKVWNSPPGSKEEGLGRLILLTPEVVKEAASTCIQTGRRITLGWSLDKLDVASFHRKPTQHEIIPVFDGICFDDVYTFNPQQSSQWDGLMHFSTPFGADTGEEGELKSERKRLFYGGVEAADIIDRKNTRIGMQYWAREGICGRGVLLDYRGYAVEQGLNYSSLDQHAVPLSDFLEVAKKQKTTFKSGDILFIRFGFVDEWENRMTEADKKEFGTNTAPTYADVEGMEEMLRWIWNEGFAAAASDNISFEVFPPKKAYPRGEGEKEVQSVVLHEYLLAGWGMPIGELFDLEELARICKEEERWEFFVASSPLNMPGGVSSPPNCLAIF